MYRKITALLVLSAAFAASGFHRAAEISIGCDGGWDLLIGDGASGRVYISHGAELDVGDAKTSQVIGKIIALKGVHGIALAPEFGLGFISNGQAGTVTIFDLKTLQKIGDDVPAGKNPAAIIYYPGSKRVHAFIGPGSEAAAIDAEIGTVGHRCARR